MLGKIIEIEGKEGLFVVVKFKDNETERDFQYVKDFLLVPYEAEKDDLEVDLAEAIKYELRGLKDTVTIRKDKKAYSKYGYSEMRGQKKIYFERVWDAPVIPSR